jgi:hypothetical protein
MFWCRSVVSSSVTWAVVPCAGLAAPSSCEPPQAVRRVRAADATTPGIARARTVLPARRFFMMVSDPTKGEKPAP